MTIEKRRAKLFGVNLYFAVCHQCECWVKSGVGQFGWIERSARNKAVVTHANAFHAS